MLLMIYLNNIWVQIEFLGVEKLNLVGISAQKTLGIKRVSVKQRTSMIFKIGVYGDHQKEATLARRKE